MYLQLRYMKQWQKSSFSFQVSLLQRPWDHQEDQHWSNGTKHLWNYAGDHPSRCQAMTLNTWWKSYKMIIGQHWESPKNHKYHWYTWVLPNRTGSRSTPKAKEATWANHWSRMRSKFPVILVLPLRKCLTNLLMPLMIQNVWKSKKLRMTKKRNQSTENHPGDKFQYWSKRSKVMILNAIWNVGTWSLGSNPINLWILSVLSIITHWKLLVKGNGTGILSKSCIEQENIICTDKW